MSTFDGFSRFNHSLIVGLSCAERGPRLFGTNCTAAGKLLAHFNGAADQPALAEFALIDVDVVQTNDSGSLQIGSQGLTWTGCGVSSSYVDSVVIYGADEAFNVTMDVGDVVVENVDYDPDLMRLQLNDLELDWCSDTKLSLRWSPKA